jgi:predicted transcriptional regulator
MSYRVQIPKGQWTPFRNEVFAKELGSLEENRAAAVYLFLYDRAYNRPSKAVATTVRQLSRLLKMDERVIKRCLTELRQEGLIRKIRSGVRRSRINKDVWKVPLAEVDLKEDSWTPIPRVLIQRYLPADPNSVLLPLLLYYQHMSWLNYSWVGVTTLSKRLNWSTSRVRDSLRSMFDKDAWYSRSELQWPLRRIIVKNDKGERRRQFRVRAIHYYQSGKKRFVRLSAAFQSVSKTGV